MHKLFGFSCGDVNSVGACVKYIQLEWESVTMKHWPIKQFEFIAESIVIDLRMKIHERFSIF